MPSIPTSAFIALACAAGLTTAVPAAVGQDPQVAGTVTQEQAARHLRTYVAPTYPTIAATAKVTGIVIVSLEIAADGRARAVGIVSGQPMLNDAAIAAVNQWRYDPFLLDGAPVTVRSAARVPFQLVRPNTTADPDVWVLPFFDEGQRCEAALSGRVIAEAEHRCASVVAMSEKLPSNRRIERLEAARMGARAMTLLGRPADAVSLIERAVQAAQKALPKTDPTIGLAWYDLAKAAHALGRLPQADEAYEQAEKALRQTTAKDSLRAVLTSYLEFLTKTGQIEAANKARERLGKIL